MIMQIVKEQSMTGDTDIFAQDAMNIQLTENGAVLPFLCVPKNSIKATRDSNRMKEMKVEICRPQT